MATHLFDITVSDPSKKSPLLSKYWHLLTSNLEPGTETETEKQLIAHPLWKHPRSNTVSPVLQSRTRFDEPILLLDNLLAILKSDNPIQSISFSPIWEQTDLSDHRSSVCQEFAELYNQFPYGDSKPNYRFFREPESEDIKVYGDIFIQYLMGPAGFWYLSGICLDLEAGTTIPEGIDVTDEMKQFLPSLEHRLAKSREQMLILYEMLNGYHELKMEFL